MSLTDIIKFFLREIEYKTWINVIISSIFNISIIISEVLFLSTFFILLNGEINSNFINNLFQKIEIYFFNFFESVGSTEAYLVVLIFFLFTKNILLLVNNFHYNTFIFGISVRKSSKILTSYINKTYEEFLKKDLSTYIKQLVKDVEIVFVGIFGLIIVFISELIYLAVLIFFISNLVNFTPTIEMYFIIFIMILILYSLYKVAKKFGDLRGVTEIVVFKTVTDILNLFKEIKIINSTAQFISRYNIFLSKFFKTRTISSTINLIPKFMFEFFLVVFFFVLYKSENSSTNMSDFLIKYSVFAIGLLRLIPSFSKLSSYSSTILYNLKSIEYIHNDLKNFNNSKFKKKTKKVALKNIKLDKVSIKFSDKKSQISTIKINNFNLNLEIGKIYGIYGKSGSGKTSLLNAISGFIKPSSGKIFFNKKQYKSNNIIKKIKIGYSPQFPTIIDENILVNSSLNYKNSKEIISKLEYYLKLFGLGKFSNKIFFENSENSSIKNMSGGEKQRVGLIRSVLYDPDLLLLDEPTSSLDKINEQKVFEFLKIIKKNKIIVVTSHKKENKKYFDKIINL